MGAFKKEKALTTFRMYFKEILELYIAKILIVKKINHSILENIDI